MAEVSNPLLQECRSSLALRSGAAVLFGIACLWPTIADAMLIKLFAVYAFVDGILTLSSGGWVFSRRSAWPLLLGGCVGVVIGATAYASPAMTLVGFTQFADRLGSCSRDDVYPRRGHVAMRGSRLPV